MVGSKGYCKTSHNTFLFSHWDCFVRSVQRFDFCLTDRCCVVNQIYVFDSSVYHSLLFLSRVDRGPGPHSQWWHILSRKAKHSTLSTTARPRAGFIVKLETRVHSSVRQHEEGVREGRDHYR
jgi:hypothetical protein